MQEREQTRATDVGPQIAVVERWDGDQRRVLVANFGPSVGITFADQPELAKLLKSQWNLLFASSERRFGGDGGRCGLIAGEQGRWVEMPARTAAIFSCSD